jgi:hypothetical protein
MRIFLNRNNSIIALFALPVALILLRSHLLDDTSRRNHPCRTLQPRGIYRRSDTSRICSKPAL